MALNEALVRLFQETGDFFFGFFPDNERERERKEEGDEEEKEEGREQGQSRVKRWMGGHGLPFKPVVSEGLRSLALS